MGLLTPSTIRAKILFQDLWQRGLEWEDRLDEDVAIQWRSWKSELSHLSCISIPRYLMADVGSSLTIELHGFGDASPKAYGAAVYIRSTDAAGKVSTHLVMSKSRVAPTKTVSLPRLELLAAVINSRLLKFVAESLSLKVDRAVCWTNSMVTLQWIRGSSCQWKTFVANRVAEIQSTWDPQHWKHCPGEDNPADLLTHGLSSKVLAENYLWWNGPKWLASSCWPTEGQRIEESSEFVEKERKPKQITTRTCAVITKEPVIDPCRYEKWSTLIRVTAYVLQWVQVQKSRVSSESRELSAEELQNAKLNWYRQIQRETYRVEYAQLETGQPLPKTSGILKLDPYFDKKDRVLRVGGRLQYSDLPEQTKHPIILPHGHPVVEKIIQSVHNELLHAGPENTLSVLRQNIWLTHGRREVKRVLMKCLVCQRQRVGPSSQKMAPLPSERVLFSPPFTHVGIDFAGPLYVQGNPSPHKSYVCIFTCASSRMVHRELTSSLSTNEFLQAFNRMISRRGICSTVWSDNAKTFKCADRQIRRLYKSQSSDSSQSWDDIDQDELQAKLASKGIKWKFIVERSPWRGGWWERLVRNVKEPLRKVLRKALLSHSELATAFTRIEAVINTRPLTTVSDDVRDLTPITPPHLALGRSLFDLPDVEEVPVNDSKTRQRYLYQQRLVNHFWKRWRGEYLHQLSIRPKWNEEQPALRVGDEVLISDDKVSRGKWPMGRVEKLFPGKDGLVRTVALKTQKGALCRPVQRLHRLEASNQECYDRDVHGGESKNKKVKESTKKKRFSRVVKSPNAILQPHWRGGEDVQARTRSGRAVRAPKRLDISLNHPSLNLLCFKYIMGCCSAEPCAFARSILEDVHVAVL